MGFDQRSKGYGTVLFATLDEAKRAVEMFQNYMWFGRALEVREDRGFIDRAPPGGVPIGPEEPEEDQPVHSERQLYIGNLPFEIQWQDLKDLFRNAGNILRADVVIGQDGRSRGYGTVLYASADDAKRAICMFER